MAQVFRSHEQVDEVEDPGADVAVVASSDRPEPATVSLQRGGEVQDLVRRLSRIEGQIRGIKRMLQEGRDCRDLVTQFAAVSRALEQAALNYVTSELVWCVEQPEEAAEHGYSVEELRKLLGRLR